MIMEKVIRSLVYHINELPNKGTFLLVAANHFPEILIANYGGVVRELTEGKESHRTPPKKTTPHVPTGKPRDRVGSSGGTSYSPTMSPDPAGIVAAGAGEMSRHSLATRNSIARSGTEK